MEGKKKKKRRAGKIILLGMSFLMTIVLTFTLTYAWFFDGDWASNYVTMAGSVGIEIQEIADPTNNPNVLSKVEKDAGGLHFNISTNLAYPGQAIETNASVFNNGGASASYNPTANPGKGSACYIRARFEVYTDIGNSGDATIDQSEAAMNAATLYQFLQELVKAQNNVNNSDYCWIYYQSTGGKALTSSGTAGGTLKYYLEGEALDAAGTTPDKGYYYLCYRNTTTNPQQITGIMKPLKVGGNAAFLWNSTFIIPWTLTNYSADKHIFVAISFQAIQTFIPSINSDTGVISSAANNQEGTLGPSFVSEENKHYTVTYDNPSLQTVFNSCVFNPISTRIPVDMNDDGDTTDEGDYIDFSSYADAVNPSSPNPDGLTVPNS